MKLSWDEYFLEIAKTVASRSNCSRRHVGAIIVKDKRIISTGYNGMPAGLQNCDEGGCPRCANPAIPSGVDLDLCKCVHAEANAVCQAALYGVAIKDSTIYSTHLPCLGCAKLIINSGIKAVVFAEGYDNNKSAELLKEAGVAV